MRLNTTIALAAKSHSHSWAAANYGFFTDTYGTHPRRFAFGTVREITHYYQYTTFRSSLLSDFLPAALLAFTFRHHLALYWEESNVLPMAGVVGLEPTWACASAFGERCNRRYATPLYKSSCRAHRLITQMCTNESVGRLDNALMAEETGFEPAEVLPSPVFETGALNQTRPLLYVLSGFILLIIHSACFYDTQSIVADANRFIVFVPAILVLMPVHV